MTKIIFGKINEILNSESQRKEFSGIKVIDMHNHSNLSDGRDSVQSFISKAKELNIGACLTDHNEISGSLEVCREILSIPSMELTSCNMHDILAYFNSEKDAKEFYNKKIKNNKIKHGMFKTWQLKLTTPELVEHVNDYNALIALPHPFIHKPKNSYNYFSNKKNSNILKKIDAIEGINGMLNPIRNKMAIGWAEEIHKPIIGSTDCHNIKYLGSVLTGCFAETRTEFIENIRKGNNYVIVNNELGFVSRNMASWNIVRKNINFFRK